MSRLLRLFVSSTFEDMHAERDWLTRIGVPELRRRCRERYGDLVAVDLRWGVRPEDLRQRAAAEICLAEIDRCDLFLAVVGHRYGWVPLPTRITVPVFERALGAATAEESDCLHRSYDVAETAIEPSYVLRDDLPDDVDDTLSDLVAACTRALRRGGHLDAGRSITEQEVRHALAGHRQVPSVVSVREHPLDMPSWLPRRLARTVSEQRPDHREALAAFRRWLQRRPGLVHYTATVAGIRLDPVLAAALDVDPRLSDALLTADSYRRLEPAVRNVVDRIGVLALDGLDDWGDAIVQAVWQHAEALLSRPPADDETNTPLGQVVAAQRRFAVRHAEHVTGRAELVSELCASVLSGGPRPILLAGPEGSGKSAVLAAVFAKAAAEAPQRGCAVVAHFVGAGRGSTTPAQMVLWLWVQLVAACGLPRDDLPRDPDELVGSLPLLLEAAARARPVVVVLDGVDQLERPGGDHELPELTWLPVTLPPRCGVLLSTRPGSALGALERHLGPARPLPELDPAVRRELVGDALRRHGKRLTDAQLDRLLDTETRPAAALPLYLEIAAEELSLFGSHQLLDIRLDRLPASTPALITQVLGRLEGDSDPALCALALLCIALGRGGVRERDVLGVLERSAATPQLLWSRLTASLAPFLQGRTGSSDEARFTFAHDAFLRAVVGRYGVPDPAPARRVARPEMVHGLLADHFAAAVDDLPAADAEALSELPHHLVRAGRTDAARQRLEDPRFLEAKTRALGVESLLADLAELRHTAARPGITAALAAALTRQAGHLASWDGRTAPPGYVAQQLLIDAQEGADPGLAAVATSALAQLHHPRFELLWRAGGFLPGLRRTLVAPHFGTRHTSWTGAVGITDDGRIVAAGGSDGIVRIFSAASGRLLRELAAGSSPVAAVQLVPGRTWILAASDEGTGIWDYELGRCVARLAGRGGPVRDAAVGTDGRWAVTAGARRPVSVWDLASDTFAAGPERQLRPHVGVRRRWAATRKALRIRGTNARRILQARLAGRVRITLDPQRAAWTSIAVGPGDRLVAAGSADGLVQVWDVAGGTQEGRLQATDGGVTALTFGATDDLVVTAWTDHTIRVWNRGARTVAVLGDHGAPVEGLLADGDARTLFSCARDGTVRRWDLQRGATGTVQAHDDQVLAMAATPDRRTIATAGGDGTVRLWTPHAMFDGPDVVGRDGPLTYGFAALVASAAAGRVIAVRGHCLHVWDLRSGAHLAALEHRGAWLAAAALTADGRWATAADDKGVIVRWDLVGRAVIASVDLGVRVESLAAAPDGSLVVVGAADGGLWVWRPHSGDRPEVLRTAVVGAARRVCVLADGRTAVMSDDASAVRVWDAAGSDRHLRALGAHDSWVTGIVPLGTGFVTSSMDGSLRIWHPAAAHPSAVLRGHTEAVRDVAAVGSRYCLSAGDDRTLRLWDTRTSREVVRLGLPTRPERVGVAVLDAAAPSVVVSDSRADLRTLRLDLGPPARATEAADAGPRRRPTVS